jgi:hypothetical protein
VALVSAPLSDDLLRDIEEKAKAATPGPWEKGEAGARCYVYPTTGPMNSWAVLAAHRSEEDAAYLASVSPDAVLSLLERLKKAEAVKRAWSQHGAHVEHGARCYWALRRDVSHPAPDALGCDCGLRELVLALEAL